MEAKAQLQQMLRRRGVDAMLVSQPDNRRYLSAFTAHDASISESSGVLLICRRGASFLLTDSRFDLHARTEATGFEVMLYPRGLLALLASMLPRLAIRRLGFESHYTLHSTAAAYCRLGKKLGIDMVPLSGLVERLRTRKNAEEISKIERSVRLNEEVFQELFCTLRAGESERSVATRIESLMRERGAERPSFDTIVASGPNGALPHAVPGSRSLQSGEPIVIDMGLVLDGYCSDMTRTVVLGAPNSKTIEIFRIVRQAQLAATKVIRAGITGKQADRAAREVIRRAGYGDAFGHGLGHGVGLNVHEAPSLNRRNGKKMQSGMVVTVEPGIYLEGWGGVRLENMVLVETDGCRVLNCDSTMLDL